MAEASWTRTSRLMVLIANVNRDPKKHRAYRPDDFPLFGKPKRSGTPITPESIDNLKVFVPADKRGRP